MDVKSDLRLEILRVLVYRVRCLGLKKGRKHIESIYLTPYELYGWAIRAKVCLTSRFLEARALGGVNALPAEYRHIAAAVRPNERERTRSPCARAWRLAQ